MAEAVEGDTTNSSASSLPRSFSYRLDSSNDVLGGRRDSSSSLLGNGRGSSESLLGSRRGSEFGSRYGFGNTYFQVDDRGIYLSSLAVTIALSVMATIGILLFTVVVTLAVMLGQCQDKQPLVYKSANPCASWALNGELNNLQGWVLPKNCEQYVAQYMHMGQYREDFSGAVDAARQYLKTVVVKSDGQDLVVLDIDETALSNLPYYFAHHYGAEVFNEEVWDNWVREAVAPPLEPMLALYKELQAQNWGFVFITGRPESQRNSTAQNLLAAGYEGWTALILRSPVEVGLPAVEYKSKERQKLQAQGYRIWSGLGDQWSDITGAAVGNRTFKLPNPMYYIY